MVGLGRVLVVDDDAEMRALLLDEYRQDGLDVVEAADGAEAILACRDAEFDVILIDENVPGPSVSTSWPDSVARRRTRASS